MSGFTKRKVIPLVVTLSLLFASFSWPFSIVAYADSGPNSTARTITILHTNDMHGSLVSTSGSVAGADKIAAMKQAIPNSILVDAGDATQGSSFASLTQGKDVIKLMNAAGYDVMAAGNHEFDYGVNTFISNAKAANFPILSANTIKDNKPILQDVVYDSGHKTNNGCNYITEVGGVKVGFFGITTPETATKTNPANMVGVTFADCLETTNEQISILKSQGAEVIVGIMHLGVDPSSEEKNRSTFIAENAEDGLNLIIDGHSHTVYSKVSGKVLVEQTGSSSSNVGRIDVTVENNEKVTVSGKNIAAKDITADYKPIPSITALANSIVAGNAALLTPVVGKTQATLWGGTVTIGKDPVTLASKTVSEARLNETNLGSLVADSMVWAAKKQISMNSQYKGIPVVGLQNGGGVRAVVQRGSITVGDTLNVLPFGNTLAFKEVTPKILYQALENGVSRITGQNAQTGLLSGADGRFPQISGIRFEYNPSKPANEKILTVYLDGAATPLDRNDDSTTLILATNDFEISGGDGYSMFAGLKSVGEGGVLDQVMANYIKELTSKSNGEFYQPITTGRIKAVGLYQGTPYTAKISIGSAYANKRVNYRVDNGPVRSAFADAAGTFAISGLAAGPHGVRVGDADDILVNNYTFDVTGTTVLPTASIKTTTLISQPSDDDRSDSSDKSKSVHTAAAAPDSRMPNCISDTANDLTVNGSYQFRITSTDGKTPTFVLGTAGVFQVQLVGQNGNDYFYKVTNIGKPGQQAGVYLNNGAKLLVLTAGVSSANAVHPALPDGVQCDTTAPFSISANSTYVFKITAGSKPAFAAGSGSFIVLQSPRQDGSSYFFMIKAVGKRGDSCGFYINGKKAPVAVATIH